MSQSTSNIVHGYLLVNQPLGVYRGVDRDAWASVRDVYSKGRLQDSLLHWFEKELGNPDITQFWGPLSATLHPCLQFLNLTHKNPEAEIVAVYSPYLERIGHPTDLVHSAEFLGFDVVPVGELSLLSELENKITRMPTVLSDCLNEFGLLWEESDMSLVAALYKKLADLDRTLGIHRSRPTLPVGNGCSVRH